MYKINSSSIKWLSNFLTISFLFTLRLKVLKILWRGTNLLLNLSILPERTQRRLILSKKSLIMLWLSSSVNIGASRSSKSGNEVKTETTIPSLRCTDRRAEQRSGYSVTFRLVLEAPRTLVRQKKVIHMVLWISPYHGDSKFQGIYSVLSSDEETFTQLLQMIWGAQFLSWSPTLPKNMHSKLVLQKADLASLISGTDFWAHSQTYCFGLRLFSW